MMIYQSILKYQFRFCCPSQNCQQRKSRSNKFVCHTRVEGCSTKSLRIILYLNLHKHLFHCEDHCQLPIDLSNILSCLFLLHFFCIPSRSLYFLFYFEISVGLILNGPTDLKIWITAWSQYFSIFSTTCLSTKKSWWD